MTVHNDKTALCVLGIARSCNRYDNRQATCVATVRISLPRVGSVPLMGTMRCWLVFLILALYMCAFLLFYRSFPPILFTPLFPCLSFPLRVDPLRFQAGCRKRRLYEALVFCVVVHFFWLVSVCFSCVRFSFVFKHSHEIGSGKHLLNDLFCAEWDVKPQLSQWASRCISVSK